MADLKPYHKNWIGGFIFIYCPPNEIIGPSASQQPAIHIHTFASLLWMSANVFAFGGQIGITWPIYDGGLFHKSHCAAAAAVLDTNGKEEKAGRKH
jgi:hypothetical protein